MNTENLVATLNHILDRRETYDQSCWHKKTDCGTTYCFAGHAQILAGKPQDSGRAASDAREWLGLSREDARWMFSSARTLPEIHWFISLVVDGVDDRDGYDRYGYNRDGYDCEGYDRDGYDCEGYSREGYDRDGRDREGYDHEGYDYEGYDCYGRDRYGRDRYPDSLPKITLPPKGTP